MPRLTVFPPPTAPPRLYKRIPAIGRIWEAYEKHFEVTVFDWPFFDPDGAREPQDVVNALHDPLAAGGLVVAEAPAVTPLLLALESGARKPDAFVAVGLDPTGETMRSLGLGEVVEAASRITDSTGRLRQVKSFLAEVVGDPELLSRVETEVPWKAVFSFEDWLEKFDQLTLGPFPEVPALVFTSAMFPLLAEGETEDVFRKIFPRSEVAHLQTYPRSLDNPATGDELAGVAIPFLQSASAELDSGVPRPTVAEAAGPTLARPNRSWETGPYMWGGVWRLRRR